MIKRRHVARKKKTKMVDDKGSLEKLVVGVTIFSKASWIVLKSSIQFCRSRILRKKSLDISEAGFMVRGGAKGGPLSE